MSFVESGGDYAIAMVDNLLDILTKGEHAKTKILQQVCDVISGLFFKAVFQMEHILKHFLPYSRKY